MESTAVPRRATHPRRSTWLWSLLLIYAVLAGAYYRLVGIDWGEYQYLHPDERFLVWVGSDITPLKCQDPEININACPPEQQEWIGPGEYFDAASSPLNPNNRGHGFYVYGTLPMFMTRFVVQWVYGHSGFNEMTDIGRLFSAAADLLSVLLVYLIAERLYNRRVGVLAAGFYAAAVMPIQQAHFFTMDTFQSFFMTLAVYFAVLVATTDLEEAAPELEPSNPEMDKPVLSPAWRTLLTRFAHRPYLGYSLGFGIALGCAVASKLSAAPAALLLPGAFALAYLRVPSRQRTRWLVDILGYLVIGALVSLFVFRIFQPYAFSGPGLLGVKPNPAWVANIREQRNQAAGDIDFPPALQWARRPVWFSFQNLVVWGLGLPLGILAWVGFLWAGWQMLAERLPTRPYIHQHALLWGWTALYFIWQSLQFNPTMRYQLPIYPGLSIFAAWLVVASYEYSRHKMVDGSMQRWRVAAGLTFVLGALVLFFTHGWAFAFSRIYVRPITRIEASRWIYQNLSGPVSLEIETSQGEYKQPLSLPSGQTLQPGAPLTLHFQARETGNVTGLHLPHVLDEARDPSPKTVRASIRQTSDGALLTSGQISANFDQLVNMFGEAYNLTLDMPASLTAGQSYTLELALESGTGVLSLRGAAPANEGDWDDGLPVRVDGYDAYGGIYQAGLNFNMYTDDNPEKMERFLAILDQADYLLISSSRQWGSLPRLPERFPLVTTYYRHLLGCPADASIEWCYNVAQPSRFSGELGFDLVKIFQSDPSLGGLRINDQFAEEAFTVYDHPKVFIFQKSSSYNSAQVRALLSAVDFSQVVRITPKRAGSHPANLMLPPSRWAEQQAGGTWSKLFPADSALNLSPPLAVLVWYLTLTFIGWLVFPLLSLALPGLVDHGYPLARFAGLLLLSYLVWLAGSARVPFNRSTILLVLAMVFILSSLAAYWQRNALNQFWRTRRRDVLLVEGLFLAFFVLDLMIRIGNPDLWHPWKGGEKPMDFAYFNAVLKSTSFPPFDPWFAGGYLNYYYYGFVLVAVPVRLLGITPEVAYNLILPAVFSMLAGGAFSLAANLSGGSHSRPWNLRESVAGIAGAIGVALIGNLGMVRMLFQGYQRLAAPGGVIDGAGFVTRWVWAIRGFFSAVQGARLPYAIGDWYWIPSRAIPAPGDVEPITEFPFFTILYGDPHAHLFALPLTLLALGCAVSIVRSRGRWGSAIGAGAGFILSGLAIGALRPTNTWDFYPYLALGAVALAYAVGMHYRARQPGEERSPLGRLLAGLPPFSQRILVIVSDVLLLVGLAFILFQPYANWYGLGYGKVDVWRGTHTPLSAYLTHWGVFLFVIVSWLAWESIDWMAKTPLSSMRTLEPYRGFIQMLIVLLLALVLGLWFFEVQIAWLVLPLAAWAGVLILRPGQPDIKRFVLFMIGTGLVLTLMVEVIVLRGDIGRMNTVFKFYLQVWALFALSAAAGLSWLWETFPRWNGRLRTFWQLGLAVLVAGAALYPLLGGLAKVRDRMDGRAPHGLDGMAFMQVAEYADTWGAMDLSQDYRAIRWMQANVIGSPVIVEANLRNLYRWGSRFSIYTGLPGVVGWEWHQQQQRALLGGNVVSERIAEIDNFYRTTDLGQARQFLQKFNVRYIILGQQERGLYAGDGLEKFPAADGVLWRRVYEDGPTVIYEVIETLPALSER